jgi:phosphopantothenoylcysteine decarboxylase/phosphopantothenate--cysteine ligase
LDWRVAGILFLSEISIKGVSGRRILVGVSGGVAAYKSAELVRRLRQAGAEVRVMMTPSAMQFITPLTLQALSGKPVHSQLLDPAAEAGMGHIELARWAEVILIAPATANVIARLAQGLADDLLTTVCLASEAHLLVAPAMNRVMWDHAATQTNCAMLRERGVRLLGPAAGEQACGEVGMGRMLEPEQLLRELAVFWQHGPLAGLKVVVTAGPTREAIDPVRFISNRSSGKMGYAVAAAAAAAGAEVILVSGPTALPVPDGVRRVAVETAIQMHDAVMTEVADSAIFVAAAAVADYRPQQIAESKIKKQAAAMTLALEPTKDIVGAVAQLPARPFTVGFAAETNDLEKHARDKLTRKKLDLIAANWVGGETGFDSEDNALEVFWDGGQRRIERADKQTVARELITVIAERYHVKDPGKNS